MGIEEKSLRVIGFKARRKTGKCGLESGLGELVRKGIHHNLKNHQIRRAFTYLCKRSPISGAHFPHFKITYRTFSVGVIQQQKAFTDQLAHTNLRVELVCANPCARRNSNLLFFLPRVIRIPSPHHTASHSCSLQRMPNPGSK